ncbi:MAG: hypothetical protein ACLTTH_09930 [Holdemanella porci]
MKGPIVSIDVSKGKSDYQAFKRNECEVYRFTFNKAGTTSRKRTHKIDKF